MRKIFLFVCTFFTISNISIAQLQIDFSYTLPLCWGSPTGSLTAQVTGGSGMYVYQWSNGASSETIDSIHGGLYSVTVTDQNLGISVADSFYLNSPSPLTMHASIQHNVCFDGTQGSILLQVEGGTPPYSITWFTSALPSVPSGSFINNLPAGNYTAAVTDNNGCTAVSTYYVTQLHSERIFPIIEVSPASCRDGLNDGRVFIHTVLHITGQPVFVWNGDTLTSSIIDSVSSGIYQLMIIDANSCSETFTVNVPYVDKPCLIVYNAFTPNNDGLNDVWYIDNVHLFPRTMVRVWNLDGVLVYESEQGYPVPWDGKLNDKLLPAGTYYYEIDMQTPIYKPYTGFVKIEY